METAEGFDHLQETKDEADHKCRSCGKQFINKKSLVVHMKLHKNVLSQEKKGDMYVCQKCGKKAKTKQALERHAAYHLDERPFACKMCHQRFKNSDDQGKHYRRLKRDGKFEHACTTCRKHFKSDILLQKHLVMLGCLSKSLNVDRAEPQKESIEMEVDGIALDKTENYVTDVKVVNAVNCRCKICELNFGSPELLKSHYRLDHGDLKKQVCIQCGQTLSSRDSLSRHYNIFHQEEFPYSCDQCEQKFKIKESLYRHVKFVHTDGGYQCTVCKHVFSQPVNLRKHMSVHREHKEHICDVCGKGFKWKQGLLKHQVLHTDGKSCKEYKRNEKPYFVNDQSYHKPERSQDEFFSDKTQDISFMQELLKAKVHSSTETLQENSSLESFQADHSGKNYEAVSHNEFQSESQRLDDTVEGINIENALQTKSGDVTMKGDTGKWDSSKDSSDEIEKDKVHNGLKKTLTETKATNLPEDSLDSAKKVTRKRKHTDNTIIDISDKHGKVHSISNSKLFDNVNPGDLCHKSKQRQLSDIGHNESMLLVDPSENTVQSTFDVAQSACFEPSNSSSSINRDMKLNKGRDMKKDTNAVPFDSCMVVDKGEKLNSNVYDVNRPGTYRPKTCPSLEHVGDYGKYKEVQGLRKSDNDDAKGFFDCNTKAKSDLNLVKSSLAFVDDNSKSPEASSIYREEEEMQADIDGNRTHLFKPSSLPLILASVDMIKSVKNKNENSDEGRCSENEIPWVERIGKVSVPKMSKKPFMIQNNCCKVTKASVCHSSNCRMQPSGDSKALDLSTTETNQMAAKTALTVPPNLTSGKFSLIKHMLSLQNEEHFDKSLFENPLYYRSAEIQDFKKLADMHRISDDVNSEEYDLSTKQNIPLHWLCLSRCKKNDRNENKCDEGSSMPENSLGRKSEESDSDKTNRNRGNSSGEFYPSDKSNLSIEDHNETTIIGETCAASYGPSAFGRLDSLGCKSPIKTSPLNQISASLKTAADTLTPMSSGDVNNSLFTSPISSTSTGTRTLVSTMRSEMEICSGIDQLQKKYQFNSMSNMSSINKYQLVQSDCNGSLYIPPVIATKSSDTKNKGFSAKSGSLTQFTGQPVNLVKHVQLNTQDTLHNSGSKNGSTITPVIPPVGSFCFNSSTRENDAKFSRSVSWSGAVETGSRDNSVEKTGNKQMLHLVDNIPTTNGYVKQPKEAFEKITSVYNGCDKSQEFAQKKMINTNFYPSTHLPNTVENSSVMCLNGSVSRFNTFSNDVYVRQEYDSCLYQHAVKRCSGHFLMGPSENVTYMGRNLQDVYRGKTRLEQTTLHISNLENTPKNAGIDRNYTSSRMPVPKETPMFSDLSNIHVKHLGHTALNQGINETQEQRPVKLHLEHNQQGFTGDILVNKGTQSIEWGGQPVVNKDSSVAYSRSTDGSERKEGVSVFELLQIPTGGNRFKDFQNIDHVLKHCFS